MMTMIHVIQVIRSGTGARMFLIDRALHERKKTEPGEHLTPYSDNHTALKH